MKIASFNINNIRKRLPNLLDWLREAGPDVVCLQELKAADAEFPAEAIRQAGYEAVWRGQKSWNGVAILARWAPVLTCSALPGDPSDTQSRYIEAAERLLRDAAIRCRRCDTDRGSVGRRPPYRRSLWARGLRLSRRIE